MTPSHFDECRTKSFGLELLTCLAGIGCAPFHTALVPPLLTRYVIDWAAAPREGGGCSQSVTAASCQFISFRFVRCASVTVVGDLGRTGAARQGSRRQRLSQKLLVDHPDLFVYAGRDSLKEVPLDVGSIVIDGR